MSICPLTEDSRIDRYIEQLRIGAICGLLVRRGPVNLLVARRRLLYIISLDRDFESTFQPLSGGGS